MGTSEAHDDLFRSVRQLCDAAVGERSIFRLLAEQGHLLFVDEMFADPQVQAREMAVAVPHPLTDALKLVASPIKMSATPPTVRRPPPLLGEHTQEVLRALGQRTGSQASDAAT